MLISTQIERKALLRKVGEVKEQKIRNAEIISQHPSVVETGNHPFRQMSQEILS